MKVKQLAKLALAATPLLMGIATPASGCLCTPNDDDATNNSGQIADGPMCSGPNAPWQDSGDPDNKGQLEEADDRNANDRGVDCGTEERQGDMCTTPATR
ncbi:MAG: hypothetical protein M3O70_00140 [Actinomycetota bacterium]|nr:hypothetical protein [Actinomycetota bacterium]